ncbi:IF2 family translation initiation factor [Rhodococcus sp. Z13]|uniref:IF2 family translation initiation factor n=1 Tax=Rhodococcus sacchari TaxID=2962047 RepID=A0ACD4DFZ9_9NOCA|nr:IF2 family translation initiation factor [Rhodococcus sp. Z13]UYP18995.1 IF2 family translation initiation factor [Rhodococcus sp. Z13]
MNLTTLPKSVLRLQYKIARFPLGFIEQQLRFLPADAPPRLMYERGLGMLDGIVGSVLDDPAIATRGALITEQADAVRRAEKIGAQATAEREARHAEEEKTPPAKVAPERIAPAKAAPSKVEPKKPAPQKSEQTEEPEKISLKDAVAKQLEAKEAEERAHDAGDVAEFEKIEHKHP